MRYFLSAAVVALALSAARADQAAVAADGTRVLLRDDGTWEKVPGRVEAASGASGAVEIWDRSLTHEPTDGRDSVRLFLHYRNKTDRKVVSLKLRVTVTDPFGKAVFKKTLDDNVVLLPGEEKKNDTYWHFDDDPAKLGQPYDKLWQLARNGTAQISAAVVRVAFDDGTVLTSR